MQIKNIEHVRDVLLAAPSVEFRSNPVLKGSVKMRFHLKNKITIRMFNEYVFIYIGIVFFDYI